MSAAKKSGQFRIATLKGKVRLDLPLENVAFMEFTPAEARVFAQKLNEAAAWIENPTKANPS